MRTKRALLVAGLTLLSATIPAFAHHSISGYYYTDQRATIKGTIVQFDFRNPHSFVEVSVADPRSGETVRWAVEWTSSARLGRQGITKDSLKPGDQVIILGQPGRKPEEHRLHMVGISRLSDGWNWGHVVG
jgi:hypothetical protein